MYPISVIEINRPLALTNYNSPIKQSNKNKTQKENTQGQIDLPRILTDLKRKN